MFNMLFDTGENPMAKPTLYVPVDYIDMDRQTEPPLDHFETEVQLAIAQYVIKSFAGTEIGKQIFDGLMPRYQDRFPYHKLLAHYLTSPEYIETKRQENADEDCNMD